ncbi:PREDICTED: melanoma-associated antigen 8-like [Odobenus rosmarus divergens]|uniref:Melanoma-associated antigen 8-like n=1 Tax=Odobenus rosmarus divergens TaxID=9708 RepID=A0A9B0M037_ODORO
MPLGQRSELWKLEGDPGPAQGLVEAQLSGAGEEEVPRAPASFSAWASSQSAAPSGSCSALFLSDQGSSNSDEEGSSPCEEPEEAQPGLQNIVQGKLADLLEFLLLKYHTKEPTSQAEMLEVVGKDAQDAFPVILGQASECMRLLFGMDVKEVDPSDHSYILVSVLGLTCDGMLSGEEGVPKTGLLVVLLGVILLHGDRAPEEEVWETLGVMGVYAGQEHIIYGETRELLTNVWVQEGYLEYQQVPSSDPARYEFPWGPRAHAETSKLQMLEYLLRVNRGQPDSSLALSEGAMRDEEEGV